MWLEAHVHGEGRGLTGVLHLSFISASFCDGAPFAVRAADGKSESESEVSKDVDGDYSQSFCERCQTLQVVILSLTFSESSSKRASSFPAVVTGKRLQDGCSSEERH